MKIARAKILKVLREKFGHRELRDGQLEVIETVLAGRNALAIMPTGAGKSLCFQLPALLLPGTTLVISPLIALMKDQTEKLDKLKIANAEVNSTLTAREEQDTFDKVTEGRTEFVYVTPERLTSGDFLESIAELKIDLMVIDEAHCISQWGHDFRPAYLEIQSAWKRLGQPPLLALTATATEAVTKDIVAQLGNPDIEIFTSGVLRPNLFYEALHVDKEAEKFDKLVEVLESAHAAITAGVSAGSGIIYCATVRSAVDVYTRLSEQGYAVDLYHGRLPKQERAENRHRFMETPGRIMVATNAFGMGIDKPDIRSIVHYQFPGSLEAYYQESGRAGRDGDPARCVLIYLKKDKSTQSFFLAGRYPTTEDLRKLYDGLKRHAVAVNATSSLSEADFIEKLGLPKSKARVMLTLLKNADVVRTDGERLILEDATLDGAKLDSLMSEYREKKEADDEKLKQMIMYAQSSMCRWALLLRYFDQETAELECGHCDNCVSGRAHRVAEVAVSV